MDFASEFGINSVTENTLLLHVKIPQTMNVLTLCTAGIHIENGLRCGGV